MFDRRPGRAYDMMDAGSSLNQRRFSMPAYRSKPTGAIGPGGAILLAAVWLCAHWAASAEERTAFSFALWGDMPYARSNDEPKIAPLIADMNASDIAFSIFDGDFKDSGQLCDDKAYETAIEMFDQLMAPAIYVPGDNEWADCHRRSAGGFDAIERLGHLRARMFAKPVSFGHKTMAFDQQGKPGGQYSENIRFDHGGIVFVAMNVTGSNNNKVDPAKDCLSLRSARTLEQCAVDNAEYAERDAANILWLHEAFARARDLQAPGLVVVVQGDPGFDAPETRDVNERQDPGRDGYTNFLNALIEETRLFAGEVLFVHGDSHVFKIDKPLVDQNHLLANFTRLETFGSPNAHWVKVTADPRTRGVFAIQPMIVPGN
jgi:hypothetical protein